MTSPRLRWFLVPLVVVATAACPGNIHHTYATFSSSLQRGASCHELYDQRARFHSQDTLTKIDRDLARIGCTSPSTTRTDR